MTISTAPAAPSRSDTPENFISKADAFLAWMAGLPTELNAYGAALNNLSTSSTSATSLTVGTGTRSLIVTTGKSYLAGMTVKVASTASPTNWMLGDVTGYNSGTGVLDVTVSSSQGSGTLAAWTVSLAATGGATLAANSFTGAQNFAKATVASHATTADIWSAAGNLIDWTGGATTTAFPAAPQAGAERKLLCAATCYFTAGANMIIDGYASGSTVTLEAGDKVTVTAETTTKFRLSIQYVSTSGKGLLRITRYTTAASGTWTKPADTRSVKIRAVGGGGGGRGGDGSARGGAGGGAGGFCEKFIAVAASSYAYTVGAGGAGHATAASTGGSTTIAGMTASGGVGATDTVGALGGAGASGDLNVIGNPGGPGNNSYLSGVHTGGHGGSGIYGGGGVSATTTGGVGTYGGGGGGAGNGGTGGAGGAGFIEIWEFA